MPRWNEEEALKLFTPLEWDIISKLAFDSGSRAAEAAEDTLGEDDELPVDANAVLPLARACLEESALLAPHHALPSMRQVWEFNFHSGWKAYDAGFHAFTYVQSPGNEESEY